MLLLPGRRPLWDGCRSYRVGLAEKGGVSNTIILIWRKDDPEVAVLPSAKIALDQHHILRQELVKLLDDGVVRLSHVIGE